jgi:hypothetical protein
VSKMVALIPSFMNTWKPVNKVAPMGLAAVCLLVGVFLSTGAHGATDAELQAARQELRLRVETERRMRRDFESLLAGGQMSAEEVADFENYLVRLAMLVDEQRDRLATLEGGDPNGAAAPGRAPALPADYDRGQTDAEKIAMLDAELGSSLSEFDEKLLREQEELAAKSRSTSSAESGEGQEGADGASGKTSEGQGQGEGQGEDSSKKADGEAGSTAGASQSGEPGERQRQGEAGEKAETGGNAADGNDQMASAGGASDAGSHTGNTAPPPDIPDGKDDDIVARQLREAAESEQDPELREKLWEEYRKYKNRTR